MFNEIIGYAETYFKRQKTQERIALELKEKTENEWGVVIHEHYAPDVILSTWRRGSCCKKDSVSFKISHVGTVSICDRKNVDLAKEILPYIQEIVLGEASE